MLRIRSRLGEKRLRMHRIFLYLKRRGFTLAEVLIATVIAGYCILPIVGSMQGGIRHTENFNHREKLRMLARSRLNKELSSGAFDHSAIDTSTAYHYVYQIADDPNYLSFDSGLEPNNASFTDATGIDTDEVLYSYKVSVEVKENVNVATTTVGRLIDPKLLTTPRGLKAVVVNAELLDGPYVIATDSISYFSLLNIPSFGDQFIWISNSNMLKILAIDPVTRSISDTFSLPLVDDTKGNNDDAQNANRPWNIDIHPTRKIVGIQCESTIRLLNIDQSSASYGKFEIVATHPLGVADERYAKIDKDDATKAEADRGFVFRPDGKYFFVTSHCNKYLYVYKIDVATDTLNWPPPVTLVTGVDLNADSDTDNEIFSDLTAGQDGCLYLAIRDEKIVIRFPMYPESFTASWNYEKMPKPTGDKKPNTVCTSSDGKFVYVVDSETKAFIAKYRSMPFSKIGVSDFTSEEVLRDIIISPDSKYLMMTDKKNATNMGGLRIATISSILFGDGNVVPTTSAYPYKITADLAISSPVGYEALFSHKDVAELYFVNIASIAAGVYTTSIPPDRILTYDSSTKPCADISTRRAEYLIVGAGNDNTDSTIEYLDLHTFKFDYDRSLVAREVPKNIGGSAQGTKFKVCFGVATSGIDTYDSVYGVRTHYQDCGNGQVVAYSTDDETVRIATYSTTDIATYSDNFFANLEIPGGTWNENGYWIPSAPVASGLPGELCRDVNVATVWVPQDMKAMTNGGFLMLFQKADGNAMLDWVGKIKWGTSNRGRYQRFARWITTANNNFPPPYAQNIAISPDERFLAIECKGTQNKVYLYDFANNNFGHETQLTGWVVDYRTMNNTTWTFGNATDTCLFTVSNPTLANGIKLKNAITSRETWRSYIDYPGNYALLLTDSVAGDNRPGKRDANKRFFGYFTPETAAEEFAVAAIDPARLFYNHELKGSHSLNALSNFTFTANQDPLSSSIIQVDQCTNGGNIQLGIHTNPSAGAIAGVTTPSVSADKDRQTQSMAGWTAIGSESTRPFNFNPTFLRAYDLAGCTNDPDSALAFSRDLANPILFQFDTVQDDIWALKPGKSFTRIDVGETLGVADKQMVISPDGQKLIFAEDTVSKRIFINNIGNPQDDFFDGTPKTQSSLAPASFGSLITTVAMDNPPRAMATKPFNTIKSTSHLGKYEQLATFSVVVMGNNNAALASGGIYIMGGAVSTAAVPSKNIFRFNPVSPPAVGVDVAPLASPASLTLAVKNNSVVAYDNMIYSLNGASGTAAADASAWVQRFNPADGSVVSSADELPQTVSPSGAYVASTTPITYVYGTTIVTASHEEGGDELYKLFDGTSANWETDAPMDYVNNPPWFAIDLGAGNERTVDSIEITCDGDRLKNFKFQGSNVPTPSTASDSADWTTLSSGTGADSTSLQTFSIGTPASYRHYRVVCLSSWSGSTAEIEIIAFKMIDSLGASVTGMPLMTKIMNDARDTTYTKLTGAAACMTPYGIVTAGGLSTGGVTQAGAYVYWPHAIDKYTDATNHSFGISRSLPPINTVVFGHSLVWHKGKVYRIGGYTGGTTNALNIDIFDFDNNIWTPVNYNSAAYFTDITGATVTLAQPAYAAVCSFGDEIFIFGGIISTTFQNTAYAWNPETSVVRQLANMPAARAYFSAVPCGSSIYLIGGGSSATPTDNSPIHKYTP